MPAPSRDWIRLVAYLGLFAIVAWWVLHDTTPPPTEVSLRQDATLSRFTRAQMKILSEAFESYRSANGRFPTGDNAVVLKALTDAAGIRHSRFLKMKMTQPGAAGTFLDPWFAPYRFEFTSTYTFTIRSAGPNGRFGDGDDITFPNPPGR